MIKVSDGYVEMDGDAVTLTTDMFSILKAARKYLGNESVDFAVSRSKKSSEEIRKELEEVRALNNFLKNF